MRESCHRCHGELPAGASGDAPLLFCPHCAAPQLLLSESMRVDAPALANTTGAMPPPRPAGVPVRPGDVDWRSALGSILAVAAVGGVLVVAGLASTAFSLVSFFWTVAAAGIAVGLYARHSPQAWVDARVGLRVGVATGLLMTAAMAVALAGTGLVLRYGTHGLANFDASWEKQLARGEALSAEFVPPQPGSKEMQQRIHGMFNSPEGRAGITLFEAGFQGLVLLLFCSGGGAFAGMLRASRSPRPGLRRGD